MSPFPDPASSSSSKAIRESDNVAFGEEHEDESSASEAAFQSDDENDHDVREDFDLEDLL
jgi:hypothetical protein